MIISMIWIASSYEYQVNWMMGFAFLHKNHISKFNLCNNFLFSLPGTLQRETLKHETLKPETKQSISQFPAFL